MLSGKANVFPFNDALQANSLNSVKRRVLNFPHHLKAGDIIFVAKDFSDLPAFVVLKLQKEFKFITKEITPHGIFAIELKDL